MTTCLLCPSQAVTDGLCVADGARLWAAKLRLAAPERATYMLDGSCSEGRTCCTHGICEGLRETDTPAKAEAFLARLDATSAERKRADDERGIQ